MRDSITINRERERKTQFDLCIRHHGKQLDKIVIYHCTILRVNDAWLVDEWILIIHCVYCYRDVIVVMLVHISCSFI